MYLGVDLGTSALKISLANNSGEIIDSISKEITLFNPLPNYYEENPEEWYEALIYCLKRLNQKHDLKEVRSIAFCGQMHGLVLLDENDEIIRNAILWNDSRTTKEVDYLNNVIGKEILLKETGNIALCGFTLPKLLWVKKHEKNNFDRIKKIMLPKDYLAYKLSGVFASDVSDLSGTLLFDVKNNKYSIKMLEIAEINEAQLPKIHNSYDVIGKISPLLLDITGLSDECKVVIGGGDQAVGGAGTNTLKNGDVFISLGTSGTVFASCDSLKIDNEARIHSFRHTNGKFHYLACTLSAANSFTWRVEKVLRKKDYDFIFNEIDLKKENEIIFLPYLSGERSPINDFKAKGIFYGLNDFYSAKDLTKSVVEGVCFSLLDNLKVMEELGINANKIRVIGGGSKSRKVVQILSDILGKEVQTITTSDGGTLGAIILAIKGDKPELSLEKIASNLVKDKETFKPNLVLHEKYLTKYLKYKRLYFATKNLN